jgi:hypothetical protein
MKYIQQRREQEKHRRDQKQALLDKLRKCLKPGEDYVHWYTNELERRANALPKFVEALREWIKDSDQQHADTVLLARANSLLRELGEI